jgi:hypothetical protein
LNASEIVDGLYVNWEVISFWDASPDDAIDFKMPI